jgi:hypothetical protein
VDKLTTARRASTATLHAYVDEMNVSRRLIDEMLIVPSDTIRTLTTPELIAFGVGPIDPIVGEAENSAQAQKLV